MKTSSAIRVIGILTFTLISTIACGPQKSMTDGNVDYGSNGGIDLSSKNVDELQALGYTVCSKDGSNDTEIGFRLMTFFPAATRMPNHRYVHLKFDKFPSNFSGTNNPRFAVFASQISTEGSETPAAPLSFGFERRSGTNAFVPAGANTYQSASWSEMQSLMTYLSVSYTSGSAFFNDYTILVDLGSFASSNNLILKLGLYDSSNNPTKTAVAIVPIIQANPQQYAQGRHLNLYRYHPLNHMWSGSWTLQQYVAEAQNNCF